MFNVHELMEYRMQQQIAHEIYRQQIMQRIPGKFFVLSFKMLIRFLSIEIEIKLPTDLLLNLN